MTIFSAILNALILAFGLIIPLGMQNIFIFNQGATQPKYRFALPSIVTAACCDTLLILLAVFGVSLLVLSVAWLKLVILIGGFFFLLYMSYSTWMSAASQDVLKKEPVKAFSSHKQILFALSVSLLNPHAIIDSVVVIGSSAINYTGAAKLAYTLTCIFVSWIWFFSLAFIGSVIHKKDAAGSWIKRINYLAAILTAPTTNT